MAYPETLTKQPSEVLTRSMEFQPALIPGRMIATCPPPVVTIKKQAASGTAAPGDLTFGAMTISGTVVQTQISGGKDGATYKLTFLAVDDQGDHIESEGYLQIKAL